MLVCGNGGSAADSEHIVGELMKGFHLSRKLTAEDEKAFSDLPDGLKIADGLLAVSEGVRALAGKAHSCNCSKNQEEGRGQKDEESGNEKSQEKQEDDVTIEQVRAVMASKSQDGKTQQVKALIQKYGADKLSGVQPEKYADLLRDAKAL